MEKVGLIIFLLLWGLVIIRQLLIVLAKFGLKVPNFLRGSMFRGTWLMRPEDDRRNPPILGDVIRLTAYLLVEVFIIVYIVYL
ncbi:MAG: hypothetical protein E3J37_01550 [Anaerolineales bacterium]|nr:MAG: hypothetical protein E3J37_01550 [Anaerolineales bacterium]